MAFLKKKVLGNKYTVLTVIAAIGVLFIVVERAVNVFHWATHGWNMASYSPWIMPISWGALAIYWVVVLSRKRRTKYFFALGISWLFVEVVWSIAMFNYWGFW